MCKKIMSVLIVFSLLIPATFASGVPNGPMPLNAVATTSAAVGSSIDSVTKRGIQEQLEEQDALEMLDIHEYIYSTTNPDFVPYGSEDEYTNVYAPYGGALEYGTRTVDKGKINVAITYLDRLNSYYFILEQQEVEIGDILLAIVGYIPFVGPLASSIANMKTFMNATAASSIKNAGGYTQITTTEYQDGTTTSIGGWTRYPYIYLHDLKAFDIRTVVFEEYDPFE